MTLGGRPQVNSASGRKPRRRLTLRTTVRAATRLRLEPIGAARRLACGVRLRNGPGTDEHVNRHPVQHRGCRIGLDRDLCAGRHVGRKNPPVRSFLVGQVGGGPNSLVVGARLHWHMDIGELLRWQRQGYARYHQVRQNLLIHIVAVPLFLVGTVALAGAIARLSLVLLAVAVGCVFVAVALQGRGHRLEPVPPEPFTGPLNFVSRLFFEQWVTFPRFVSSGGWLAALRKAPEP